MSRRVTKADLEAENKALRRARDVLSHALNAFASSNDSDDSDAVRGVEAGERYSILACDLKAYHGGIVIVVCHVKGRKSFASAYYLDDWAPIQRKTAEALGPYGELGRVHGEFRNIADRFWRLRQSLCDAEKAS